MSASAVTPPVQWPAERPASGRSLPAAVPVLGAALLGAAVATRSPLLIGAAAMPLLIGAITRPMGAVIVFMVGFYLNLPVIVAHHAHVSGTVASAFALLLLAPFLAYVVIGRRPLVITPALALMVGYFVVLVTSAALPGGGASGSVTPIVTFLTEGLLLYVLVSNVVRSPEHMRWVIWTLILAGAFLGLVSLWQELTHSYHNTLGGLAQVDQTGFNVGNDLTGKEIRPRLAGPIGEKNRYAQILLVLLPLAVSRVRAERTRLLQLAAAGCAALILCGVLLTFSRGAAIAMVVLIVAMAVLRMITARQLLALALGVVALVLVAAPDFILRVQTLGSADTALSDTGAADGAIVGRATENLAALYVFRDHPLLGVGPGQFFTRYSEQYGNALDLRFLNQNRRAHSLYLEIAADTGAIGLGAFLAIVGVTMMQLWKLAVFWRGRSDDLAQLALAFLLALVGYLSTGVFLQLAFQRYFWVLMALANATIWMLRRQAARVTSPA